MTTISGTFTADGASTVLSLGSDLEDVQYTLTAPIDGTVHFEKAVAGQGAWEPIAGPWTDITTTRTGNVRMAANDRVRMRANDLTVDHITNGTFASDTVWTKGSGWAIAAGVAAGTTASTDLEQTVSIVAGASYLVTFTTASVSNGTVTVKLGGGDAGTVRSTSATFAQVIVAGSSNSLIEFTGDAYTGTIDNVTMTAEITYSFNDTDQIIHEVKDLSGNVLATVRQSGWTFPGTVAVTGAATVTGALTVTGAQTFTGATALNGAVTIDDTLNVTGAVDMDSTVNVDGAITMDNIASAVRTGQRRVINVGAKVGATAGWAVNAGDNLGLLATLPTAQTASTLVVPVPGLKVGDTITAFSVVGQIESAGNIVTLDANLRKLTAAAADVTDASVDTITQISVTADAIVSASKTLGTPEVVAADETFYVLITGTTTTADCDVALQGITVTVTEA